MFSNFSISMVLLKDKSCISRDIFYTVFFKMCQINFR